MEEIDTQTFHYAYLVKKENQNHQTQHVGHVGKWIQDPAGGRRMTNEKYKVAWHKKKPKIWWRKKNE